MSLSNRAPAFACCALLLFAAAACDDGPPPAPLAPGAHAAPEAGVLRLAGTGSMTPLAIVLSAAWANLHREPLVVVEPSVGSTGGVRAAADGAVDLGMVARPLSDSERRLGLVVVPVARDAVVMAANPSVPIDALTSSELEDLMWGRRTHYADGSPATMLLRDRDDTAHSALEELVPGLREAREEAYRARRFRVLLHDDAMAAALMVTPGAIGPHSLGAIAAGRLRLKALSIDGIAASFDSAEQGRWKATRELSFVSRADRSARAAHFLAFVAGAQGAAILRAHGYLPLAPVTP